MTNKKITLLHCTTHVATNVVSKLAPEIQLQIQQITKIHSSSLSTPHARCWATNFGTIKLDTEEYKNIRQHKTRYGRIQQNAPQRSLYYSLLYCHVALTVGSYDYH